MAGVAPEVLDLSKETAETHALYGVGEKPTDAYARECLLARRLCEAGVRYIQVSHRQRLGPARAACGRATPRNAAKVDRPIAGLLTDLKRRGLLDDTLVVWGGEFGRTLHRPRARTAGITTRGGFTMWMAGGGSEGRPQPRGDRRVRGLRR